MRGLELVLVDLGVLFVESKLHFLLHLEHLDLLDHGAEFVNMLLLLLQVQAFLSNLDLAGLYLLHDGYLFVGLLSDFHIFLINLAPGE